MLSLLMYVQFIQLVSLVLKDEIITWFAVIMISLVSCFVITGWNPFSYILSFNIDFYYEKTFILFFINLLIPFISCVFIENMDFDGIEARYFLNNEQDTEFYIKFAKEKGLYYTAGSDFHTRIEEYRIHGLIGDVFLNAEEIEDFLAQSGLDIWVEEFFL